MKKTCKRCGAVVTITKRSATHFCVCGYKVYEGVKFTIALPQKHDPRRGRPS